MKVLFKKISPLAQLPSYAHEDDAGMDIRSAEALSVPPGGRALVHTGLVMELPSGYEAQVRPRSGLALKRGITVLNTPGTIDAGYRGEVGVILFNSSPDPFAVEIGDKIAQIVVSPVTHAEIALTDDVGSTDRGEGGFGSTGV